MSVKEKLFLNDMLEFCRLSMDWCMKESEAATIRIGGILEMLLNDAKRVSTMSEEALVAVSEMKNQIQKLISDGKTSDLISNLKKISSHHIEVNAFVEPIIRTLQFQDRISQNMQNEVRMMNEWFLMRNKASDGMNEEEFTEFGKRLLKLTTMVEERDTIREVIPGLPVEESSSDMVMF